MVTRALEETAGDISDDDVEMLEEIEQIDVSRSRSRAARRRSSGS